MYLDENKWREAEIRAQHLSMDKEMIRERRLIVMVEAEPLVEGFAALGFDDADAAVVALDEGAAPALLVGAVADPAGGGVVKVEQLKGGALQVDDVHPGHCIGPPEEVESSDIVKLEGQVHARHFLVHPILVDHS